MKKLILLISFILLTSISILGRAKVDGIAGKGKTVNFTSTIRYNLNETYPSCTVTVYLAGTTTLASIYADDAGTIKSNSFFADSTGYYFFYVNDGRYDIRFSGTGIVTPFTKGDVIVYDYAKNLANNTTIGRTKLDKLPADPYNPTAVEITSPLVVNRKKVYNISSYNAVANNSTDNKAAIDYALQDIGNNGGGVLEFNGDGTYATSGGHIIPSNVTIEGAFASESGNCRVRLINTVSFNYIFKIGQDLRNIHFKDIELSLPTNGIGVLIQGTYPHSTFNITFDHTLIYGGIVGIDVDQLSGASDWEANNIYIYRSAFINQTIAGIRCDTINTLFNIVSSLFNPATNADGFLGIRAGQFNIESSLGLGTVIGAQCILGVTNTALSRTFLRFTGEHGTITIKNSPSERMQEHLRIDYASYQWPVLMEGTQVQAKVILDADVKFTSIANGYFRQGVEASDDARIYSYGDTTFVNTDFCGTVSAIDDPFSVSGGAIVVKQDGMNTGNVNKLINYFTDDGIGASSLTDPLTYFKTDNVGKYLLKLGNDTAYYYVEEGSDGLLHFGTNRLSPFKGYKFDGVLDILGQATANNSSANRAVIYFDTDDNWLKLSRNTGAYEIVLSTPSGFITNRLIKASSLAGTASSDISSTSSETHILAGDFYVDLGKITLTNGNLNLTSGNINITNGNITQTTGTSFLNTTNMSNGLSINSGRIIENPVVTFANGDTTPSISTSNYFVTANAGATSITMFDDGANKQTITVFCGDSNTTFVDGGNLKLAGNLVCTADDVISLYFNGTNWIELDRSAN